MPVNVIGIGHAVCGAAQRPEISSARRRAVVSATIEPLDRSLHASTSANLANRQLSGLDVRDCWRRPFLVDDLLAWYVSPQHDEERAAGRARKPIGFHPSARRGILDVDREASVLVELDPGGSVADRVPVERIGREVERRVVKSQGPETVDLWKLVRRKPHDVAIAPVESLPGPVLGGVEVDGLLRLVGDDATKALQ